MTVVIGYDGDAVEAVKRAAERLRTYFEVFIADIADADKDWDELAETEVYGIFAYRLLSVLEYKLKKVQERFTNGMSCAGGPGRPMYFNRLKRNSSRRS